MVVVAAVAVVTIVTIVVIAVVIADRRCYELYLKQEV
jgi:hypothetical protein